MTTTPQSNIQTRSKLRFLLVDSDRDNITTSCAVIQRMGFTVDRTAEKKEAIALCEEKPFDVIFIDIDSAEINGLETTKAIRNLKNESHEAYIVALSKGIQSKDIVHNCIDAGMNDCIVKPLSERVLRQRVKLWSRLHSAGFLA